jgi:hypothetical protein
MQNLPEEKSLLRSDEKEVNRVSSSAEQLQ